MFQYQSNNEAIELLQNFLIFKIDDSKNREGKGYSNTVSIRDMIVKIQFLTCKTNILNLFFAKVYQNFMGYL